MTETPVHDDIDVIVDADNADDVDEAEQWLVRRPRLMSKLSWTLLALLVAAAGFAAGASLKQPQSTSSNAFAGGGARAFAAFGTGNGAGGGFGRQGGGTAASTPAASDATVGVVKLIDGANVYVQTSAGVVVKIATSPTTAIEISNPGALADLHVGDTLSATGSAGADGTVAATSISRTAASADAAAASPASPTTSRRPGVNPQAAAAATPIDATADTAAASRVLVVDDDESLRDLLTMALRHVGYEVHTVGSSIEARNAVERAVPDLIILDVMLPDGEGIELCTRLRRDGFKMPVLFLTARDTTDDKVRGLTLGGDDYLTKPFSIAELAARVAALLRRMGGQPGAGRRLSYGEVVLDDDRHEVTCGGTAVELSPTEFKLLRYFLSNPEITLSKNQILDSVWAYSYDGGARVVETYVSYLRRKLEPLGGPLIHTVRGVGYRLPRQVMRQRLRRHLVILIVGLSALGLIVTGTIGTLLLRQFELSRVDSQLQDFATRPRLPQAAEQPRSGLLPGDRLGPRHRDRVPPRRRNTRVPRHDHERARRRPAGDRRRSHAPGTLLTVPGRNDGHHYRAIIRSEADGGYVVMAVDLSGVDSRWHQQALAAALVGGTVLVLVGVAAWLSVRRELRPLSALTTTADSIADGAWSNRAPIDHPESEVGHLSTAFNSMLDRLQAALEEVQHNEDKLLQFVADASHELRTPLASIRGFAELYRRGGARDPEHTELAMRRIEQESTRLSAIVEQLVALARFDEAAPRDHVPVDLAAVVDDAAHDLRAVAPDRSITVSGTGHPQIVIGDDAQLRQLAANLTANARLHSPEGTPIELVVDTVADRVELAVVDHGPGIPPAERDRVFGRFVRLDSSRTRTSGSAGLGLAIAEAISAAHGGTIRITTTPGGGATFTVSLPRPVDATGV